MLDDLENDPIDADSVLRAALREKGGEALIALERRCMNVNRDRRRAGNRRCRDDRCADACAIDVELPVHAPDVLEQHVGALEVRALAASRESFECEQHRVLADDLEDWLKENRETARREDVVDQRAPAHRANSVRRWTVAAMSASAIGFCRKASAPSARALRCASGAVEAVRMTTRVSRE